MIEKLYWKTKNAIQAPILQMMGNPGLLPNRKDPRDHESDFGISLTPYKPKYNEVDYFRYQFLQTDNICTAAGAALALSEQMSVRFSVKALMRMMVKQGMVNGNGLSYQRAPLEIIVKYGLIPYHLMPDENPRGSWKEYSKWDAETERLYAEVAPQYKMSEYTKLRTEGAIFEANDNGYVDIPASDWHSGMNRPKSPNYFLEFIGSKVGGHQYRGTGYRKAGEDFVTPQTFGEFYGDNGKAYSRTLFGKGYFDNWIVNFEGSPMLPTNVLLPLFLRENEGLMVKAHDHLGDSRCYVIENGQKRHVSGEDDMKTFQFFLKKTGLTRVNKVLLDATPLGKQYPFIS